jgi:hypothetical protein
MRLKVLGRETKSPIRGKLTFYFQVRDGKGVVLDPDQMPGGPARPKPRPAQSAPPQGPPPAPPAGRAGGHATAKTITVEEFKKSSGKAIVLCAAASSFLLEQGFSSVLVMVR